MLDSGVPGVPGVAVLRPVDKDGPPGLEAVILMVAMIARMEMKVSLKAATLILVKVE